MKQLIIALCLFATACSSFGEVTFNKQDTVKKSEFNKLSLNWERELKQGDYIGEITPTRKVVQRIYPKNVNRSTRVVTTPNEIYNAD